MNSMKITVNDTLISVPAEYDEYLDLLGIASVKPGDPVPSKETVVQRILTDNYDAHIRQYPSVRPAAIAAKIKELEEAANVVFKQATTALV